MTEDLNNLVDRDSFVRQAVALGYNEILQKLTIHNGKDLIVKIKT